MQALSQLSYGPTMLLLADYHIDVLTKKKHFCEIFSLSTKPAFQGWNDGCFNKKDPLDRVLIVLMMASPRGFEPRSPP